MLISKFDLYKSEWLELVFDNRNKEYGAYYLRQHYAGNMIKAMIITFSFILLLFVASIIFKTNAVIQTHRDLRTVVTLTNPVFIKPPLATPKKPIAPSAPVKPITQVKTQQDLPFVVKPDVDAKNPIENEKLTGAIGPVTVNAPGTGVNVPPEAINGNGTQPGPDESVHPSIGLDVMPEPIGGATAWAKFLNKNLRFPPVAQEDGVSGKVFLSFVIEKDGSLSNIVIEKGAGHGFDEEALRVLKLAKAWKPGMQNGQAVRVRYIIPINFQLADN